jgi:hexosaminidase
LSDRECKQEEGKTDARAPPLTPSPPASTLPHRAVESAA